MVGDEREARSVGDDGAVSSRSSSRCTARAMVVIARWRDWRFLWRAASVPGTIAPQSMTPRLPRAETLGRGQQAYRGGLTSIFLQADVTHAIHRVPLTTLS